MKTKTRVESYWGKLQRPQWQKKRLTTMQRDGFACRHCPSVTEMLTVHHVNYESGRNPWDYPDENFLTLCDPCHKNIEAEIKIIRRVLALDRPLAAKMMILAREIICQGAPIPHRKVEPEVSERDKRPVTVDEAKEHFRQLKERLARGRRASA